MTAATTATTLRERQREGVRQAVLEAVLSALESRAAGDLSMAEVADLAGISLRTLYRYFPDRSTLLEAAGEHLYRSLDVPFDITAPEDISASLLEAARRLSTRPELTRALLRTPAGRSTRSGVRGKRVDAIASALEPLTAELDADTARQAVAVITHLCSAASWVIIAEESGLDDLDAQRAAAWAIDALVSTLRRTDGGEPDPQPAGLHDRAHHEEAP